MWQKYFRYCPILYDLLADYRVHAVIVGDPVAVVFENGLVDPYEFPVGEKGEEFAGSPHLFFDIPVRREL